MARDPGHIGPRAVTTPQLSAVLRYFRSRRDGQMSVPQYKRAAAIALAAGLGFSIAACSTKGSDDSGKDAAGKTVITVDCQPDGSQKDLLKNWNDDVAAFEKANPD